MNICKCIGSGFGCVLGWLWYNFAPTLPLNVVVVIFILYDAWTAYKLDVRVRKKYPEHATGIGKFYSFLFGKVIRHTIPERVGLILLAFIAEKWVFTAVTWSFSYIVTGAILMEQFVSILENEASCRDQNEGIVFKLLQKILVDKTSRHIDCDLSELLNLQQENQNETR